MTSISERFKSLREGGECALIPFITAGDPDLETTAKALMVLEAAGAAMIEGGFPTPIRWQMALRSKQQLPVLCFVEPN